SFNKQVTNFVIKRNSFYVQEILIIKCQSFTREIVEIIHLYGELHETDSVCLIERIPLNANEKDISKYLVNDNYKIYYLNLKTFKKKFSSNHLVILKKTEKLLIIKKLPNLTSKLSGEQSHLQLKNLFMALLDAGFNVNSECCDLFNVIQMFINMNYHQWFENVTCTSKHSTSMTIDEQILTIVACPKRHTSCEFNSTERSLKSKRKLTGKYRPYSK
ncbi:epidermal growth factor receptor kinase substrate 8, partial [Schistosoma japonicum]